MIDGVVARRARGKGGNGVCDGRELEVIGYEMASIGLQEDSLELGTNDKGES